MKFKNMYKLILTISNNQSQLTLNRSNTIIRTWYGSFAQIIYNKVTIKNSGTKPETIHLQKNEIHVLFTEITCLYQTLIYQYKIDADLIKNNFPRECFIIAESLLLQIRLNSIHPSYDDLQGYFLDEFKHFDCLLFSQTINLLIGKNLIQSIITEDGQQFFDKNPQPHDHIYFKQHKKLVDCSKEISDIFLKINEIGNSRNLNANIFTINRELL